jgi:hypothetical protein
VTDWIEDRGPPPAEHACTLARGRFWLDELRRVIGTHPAWPDAASDLRLPEELAHALVLVLSRVPASGRRDFADAFYAESRGVPIELPPEPPQIRLAVAAGVVLLVVALARDVVPERVVDLLRGAAQGDDLTQTPEPALAEVRKTVARIRFEVAFEDPADPRGAAALAVAEVLDPASEGVALREVVARSAWAAVASWEPGRVLRFLLDADRVFAEAAP